MQKNNYTIGGFLFVIAFSGSAVSSELEQSYVQVMRENAPYDFQQLFIAHPKAVKVILVNGSSVTVDAMISAYNLQISAEPSLALLRDFLLNNDVAQSAIDNVLTELSQGVDTATDCKGERQKCEVTVPAGRTVTVVVDDTNNMARLILTADSYTKNAPKAEYVSAYNKNRAIINSPMLYSNYFSNRLNFNLNNRTVIGLPYGSLRSELQTTSYNGKVDNNFQNLAYDLEIDKYRMIAGQSRDFNTLNSTSLLSFSSLSRKGVYVFSSRNLAKNPQNSYQRLYFYMPQSGAVEVWRDGEIIFSQPIEAGQQFISYDQLPNGNYTVTLKLKSGNSVVSEQTTRIVNTSDFKLNTGELDFTAGVSRTNSNGRNNVDIPLLEGDVMYRLTDSFMLGGGASASGNNRLYKLGGKWFPVQDFSLTGALGVFSDQSRYYTASASYGNVNLTYNRYNRNNASGEYYYDDTLQNTAISQPDLGGGEPWAENRFQYHGQKSSHLSDVLLGADGYQQLTLSSSYSLGYGNGYISALYQTNQYGVRDNGKNINYNVGYNIPFIYNSSLGTNLSINRYRNRFGQSDNLTESWFMSVNLSIPLGKKTSLRISSDVGTNNTFSSDTSVQRNFQLSEASSASLAVGSKIKGQDSFGRLNGSLSTQTDSFNMSASASATTQAENESNIFVNMSGAQIIDRNGLYFSNVQSDSYLLINDETPEAVRKNAVKKDVNGKIITHPQAQLVLGNGNKQASSIDYYANGKSKVIPLQKYKNYHVQLNSSAFGVYNTNESESHGFTHPGTTLSLSSRFQPEFQLIGSFYTSRGTSVKALSCEGASCVRVEKLDDGLFKILLKGQDEYQLKAGEEACYHSSRQVLSTSVTRVSDIRCYLPSTPKGPVQLANQHGDNLYVAPLKQVNSAQDVKTTQRKAIPSPTVIIPDAAYRFGVFRLKENALALQKQLQKSGMSTRLEEDLLGRYQVYGVVSLEGAGGDVQRSLVSKYSAILHTVNNQRQPVQKLVMN